MPKPLINTSSPGHQGGGVGDAGIQPITVARIVQKHAAMAGLDPGLFGGHSRRSGFVTEAGMQGKPMGDIMALSGHRTDDQMPTLMPNEMSSSRFR